jgi:hypothetical protein
LMRSAVSTVSTPLRISAIMTSGVRMISTRTLPSSAFRKARLRALLSSIAI